MKYFYHIITLVFLLLSSSCIKETAMVDSDSLHDTDGISICLKAASSFSPDIMTKSVADNVLEGTEENYRITDFIVFQFDEHGNRLVEPQYYDYNPDENGKQEIPIIKPGSEVEYTIVILANTHNEAARYTFAEATTLDILMTKFIRIKSLQDTYVTGPSNEKHLIMNGFTKIDKNTEALSVDLFRNVAKLTLSIQNLGNSGITIKSVQIKSVPSKIDYFTALLEDRKPDYYTAPYPDDKSISTFDYEADNIELLSGNSKILDYYIPCHLMGTNTMSTSKQTKGRYAPEKATYVEIYGISNNGSKFCRYRFYLGSNMVDNYDIVPNYHYSLPVTFNGIGDPQSDTRVEFIDAVSVLDEANSYIINPLPTDEQKLYSIPVADRINRYWIKEAEATHIGTASGFTIMGEDEWKVDIIWQSSPEQMIEFYNTDGSRTGNEGRDFPCYRGQVAINLKPKKDASGNLVIGVYRTDNENNLDPSTREYAWSWHLWITDYNPDEALNERWQEGTCEYALSNNSGSVFHYEGTQWKPGKKYYGKWIMDRNLGALSQIGGYNSDAVGMYYQFGRKDPFVVKKIYNNTYPDGTYLKSIGSLVTKEYLIQHPNIYIGRGHTSPYLLDNPYFLNLWDNPSWNIDGSTCQKSYFDPCPPGWKLPENDAFYSGSVLMPSTGGVYLYCNGIKDSDEITWFPVSNYIYTYGNSNVAFPPQGLGLIIIRTATTSQEHGTPCLVATESSTNFRTDGPGIYWPGNKSAGGPVRCIQE